jgi:hypothetical protein
MIVFQKMSIICQSFNHLWQNFKYSENDFINIFDNLHKVGITSTLTQLTTDEFASTATTELYFRQASFDFNYSHTIT